ncbi:hypothetical protein [Streptantibioticus ferralitis]|uniref:Uncharacterized protein n=1 Tax=Streptantibioticus ferralitis TaxID=236510 RepID=A0ABT5Z0P2_9ACTN|nr:hypothetical protein [Streptantibioticus ferralitis]MDF2257410.1 hypothetical protein [Streptantibioticus ferralitis]
MGNLLAFAFCRLLWTDNLLAKRRRAAYGGQPQNEKFSTLLQLTSPDVAEDIERTESVSIAMLTVWETLGLPLRPRECSGRGEPPGTLTTAQWSEVEVR